MVWLQWGSEKPDSSWTCQNSDPSPVLTYSTLEPCLFLWTHNQGLRTYLRSSGSNIQGEVEGALLTQIAHQGFEKKNWELLRGKKGNSVLPNERSFVCPLGPIYSFFQQAKIWVSGQTCRHRNDPPSHLPHRQHWVSVPGEQTTTLLRPRIELTRKGRSLGA